jgi:F-type H+-transporting ATPase subunit b
MEQVHPPAGEIFNFGMLHLEWPSALFVLVVFIITMFLLNNLLFKPILRTLDARKAKFDANNDKAKSLDSTIESSEKDYKEKRSDVNEKIRLARQKALVSAKEEASKILEQVKASTSEKLDAAEKEIAQDQKKAMDQVTELSKDLAQLINAKVLA